MSGTKTIKHTAAYDALNMFLRCYLTLCDVDAVIKMADDNIYFIGARPDETACGKSGLDALLHNSRVHGGRVGFKITNYHERSIAQDAVGCMCDLESMAIIDGEGGGVYNARLTAGLRLVKGKWIVFLFHISGDDYVIERLERRFFGGAQQISHASFLTLIEMMTELVPGGVMGWRLDEGFSPLVINETARAMLGYSYDELLDPVNGGGILRLIHPDDRKRVIKMADAGSGRDKFCMEYRIRRSDGEYICVYNAGRKIQSQAGKRAALNVIVDITDKERDKRRLREEASRDYLTGLYNRRAVENAIKSRIESIDTYGLLLFDIDNFKSVNDIYGHTRGDEVLVKLAKIVTKSLRPVDMCARIGGDEFVIFMPDVPSKRFMYEKARELVSLYEDFTKLCPECGMGLSFGGVFSDKPLEFSELYSRADAQLYQVKRSNKSGVMIVTAG